MLQRKGKGISFPCTFAQDLYEKINLNPAFTLSHSIVETIIAMKSLVILSARVIFIELIQGLVMVLIKQHPAADLAGRINWWNQERDQGFSKQTKNHIQHRHLTPPIVKNV